MDGQGKTNHEINTSVSKPLVRKLRFKLVMAKAMSVQTRTMEVFGKESTRPQ